MIGWVFVRSGVFFAQGLCQLLLIPIIITLFLRFHEKHQRPWLTEHPGFYRTLHICYHRSYPQATESWIILTSILRSIVLWSIANKGYTALISCQKEVYCKTQVKTSVQGPYDSPRKQPIFLWQCVYKLRSFQATLAGFHLIFSTLFVLITVFVLFVCLSLTRMRWIYGQRTRGDLHDPVVMFVFKCASF